MLPLPLPLFLLSLSAFVPRAACSVTVYGQQGVTTPSGLATSASATATTADWIAALAAYNDVTLTVPANPSPAPTAFAVSVANQASNVNGLSVAQAGDFFGFSIEMSVVQQVIGKNGSYLMVPFLNLLASVADRAGRVRVRVGGNTQEYATLVASLADNAIIEKDKENTSNPTNTPTLDFTTGLLYMMSNVSSLVAVKWYLGIPFNDTSNLRLQIAEAGDAILGDNILAYQVGNEPDLYAAHNHRASTYNQTDYIAEFDIMVNAINANSLITTKNNLVAPVFPEPGHWTPSSLSIVSVEHYPDNNCAAAYPNSGFGDPVDPQTVISNYLTHASGQSIVSPYLNGALEAAAAGKEFMMFETNTASCGGFEGVSDAFVSALWAVDYGLQMAYSNFTGALIHVGGQDVSYNPFTPPPTNLSSFKEWTVGPTMYASVVLAEALGNTGTAQVIDLFANSANAYTPGYAIYENSALARIVLVNFMTEANGTGSYTATISVGGGETGEASSTPSSVKVKYLSAPTVVEKDNITWAGQTFGGRFQADGRLSGEESIATISCDTTAATCAIPVPGPGVAVVFLSSKAQSDADPTTTQTFATTVLTKTANTATIDPSVLATSNGMNGLDRAELGGTSQGGANAAAPSARSIPGLAVLCALAGAVWVLGGASGRR
ncbi:uncharacterized protein BXZ73DRAFT_106718 [Epithele typhae]|uniref:uncharacterized protein n=1 Tax=Epithele typhae TaxID=378194 RepID=UPI002007D6F6|nr:uncharacterized protein BXZ73DRAFT_106718 [Epithele typhae]KAH9914073.1 hypothetical protein BXZ73DRAFT_106718 [Epithele typhae]